MTIFAVHYTYDRRGADLDRVRPEHRRFLAGLEAVGTVLASGPYAGPGTSAVTQADGALLIVRGASAEEVGSTLDADPFAREGLISAREVRPWTPVFGPWA